MNSDKTKSKLCVVCDKFYGTQETQFMCSGCFKAAPKEIVKTEELSKTETAPKVPPVDTSRCATCTRKVGLFGYNCKCGKVFCAQHHLPEEHPCTFNYREEATKKLKN